MPYGNGYLLNAVVGNIQTGGSNIHGITGVIGAARNIGGRELWTKLARVI